MAKRVTTSVSFHVEEINQIDEMIYFYFGKQKTILSRTEIMRRALAREYEHFKSTEKQQA
jgi:hypothetical protein